MQTLVLTLHVLAATVWVGGQLVLAVVVPVVRRGAPDLLPAVGRAYARLAWPAFGILLVTGGYNVSRLEDPGRGLLAAKLALVVVSGVGAFVHQRADRPQLKGAAAGVGLLAGIAVVLLGVVLSNHG